MAKRIRQIGLLIADILAIHLSFLVAFYIRFDQSAFYSQESIDYFQIYLKIAITVTLIKIVIFYLMKMYNSLWRYASVEELVQIVFSSLFATTAFMGYMLIVDMQLPRSIYVLTFVFDTLLIGGVRLSYRIIRVYKERHQRSGKTQQRVLVIGAGRAGATIIKELKNHVNLNSVPVAVIDDDLSKIGSDINGVLVVGTRLSIREVVLREAINQIIIAIPSASKSTIQEIIKETSGCDCDLKIVPGIYELIDGKLDISSIRNVEITDLLGRDEIKLNTDAMEAYVNGKTILVTGGGGSIGSELCRQIARFNPDLLVVLDIYENGVFSLEHELKKTYPNLKMNIVIASVRDAARLDEVLNRYRPFVVFHAAAHKHVPLMEANPTEAIKNNIFGTYNLIQAAKKHSVDRFVLISTDKAVNPTNVMGATKRIAEMLIQSQHACMTTKFVAVRFGNVLGSNGSVIPIFKKQIEEGGPITVTHPDIERYFMTIPEAARLVIQASSFAGNSEIFVLDMGEPVKIVQLAENIIRLSGLKPYEDIQIQFTGLRPGEKMFEELILNEEHAVRTAYEKIFIEKLELIDLEYASEMLEDFQKALECDEVEVRKTLKRFIPTYEFECKI